MSSEDVVYPPSNGVMRSDVMLFAHPKFADCAGRDEIWSYIVKLSLRDGHNNPNGHALDRVKVALICKACLSRVYGDESLWTSLYLNHRLEPEQIRFALSHCGEAALRVRIVFLDIRCRQDVAGTERSVDFLVDRLFASIAATSGRWKSFYLQTEHPGAFMRVRDHCFRLPVPSMTSLALNYGYLPGYSEYPENAPIYTDALELFPWFNGTFGSLDHLELVSVYVPWHGSSLLSNVTSLDFSSIYDIDWDFFHELFTHAVHLKFLRMEAISDCEIPLGYTPRLPSLLVLDVGLDDSLFMFNLMIRLDAPLLTDLTVRDIDSGIPHLLVCSRLLKQITRFAIFGLLAYTRMECLELALGRLFSILPALQVLDLRHAEEDVFPAFCRWSYAQKSNGQLLRSPNIRAVYLAEFESEDLLKFVIFHGANDNMDGSQMHLRHMCVNPPTTSYDSDLCTWLKEHIFDFRFRAGYDRTVSVLRGPSFHSLCSFLP